MNTAAIQHLEKEADEQRRQLLDTASQLREKLEGAREKFSVQRNLQEHFGIASLLVSVAAFSLGYGITGIFRSR